MSVNQIDLCGEPYDRSPEDSPLKCQYIKDHPSENHSWFAVKMSDDHWRAQQRLSTLTRMQAPIDDLPMDIQKILDFVNEGLYDPYLEALLAAGHSRKRRLRGVRSPYGV